jgi:spore germination cell wall hydrolase CwlJ-like protein
MVFVSLATCSTLIQEAYEALPNINGDQILALISQSQYEIYVYHRAAAAADPPERRPSCRFFLCTEKAMTTSDIGRDILARTLWGEARGESLAGWIAVA